MASSSTLVENVQAAVACAGSGEAAAAVALGAGGESALHQPIVQTIVDSIEGRNSVTFVAPSQSAAAAGATGGQNQCQEEGLDEMERDPQTTEELAAVIQSTLSNLQNKFTNISDGILNRVDQMSTRIDALERSIAELMTASGVDTTEIPYSSR